MMFGIPVLIILVSIKYWNNFYWIEGWLYILYGTIINSDYYTLQWYQTASAPSQQLLMQLLIFLKLQVLTDTVELSSCKVDFYDSWYFHVFLFSCITGPVSDGTFNPNQGTGTGTICSSTKPFTVCIKTNGVESYDTNQPLSEVTDAHGDRGFTMRK